MTIIDGTALSRQLREEIRREVSELKSSRRPCLAAILVGHDGGSESYVSNKIKACNDCGVESKLLRFDTDISESMLLREIERLNDDPAVDGFIVQLPLPRHIDEQKVIDTINPDKDVDGFTAENFGRMALGLPAFIPATPGGILEILKAYNIETRGKHCVILGRSNIVGKPLALLMLRKGFPGDCTVTVCHSGTPDIASVTRTADILVAAVGSPGFVTADMVKEGAAVIDVGITRVDDASTPRGWRLAGDVDYDSVAPKTSFITHVPGGVGPMTVVSLIKNTIQAFKRHDI